MQFHMKNKQIDSHHFLLEYSPFFVEFFSKNVGIDYLKTETLVKFHEN